MVVTISPPSERRERLLDTAATLFARWGFDKTSVDDIARETGISKGAVYLEFPGKDALFSAVLQRQCSLHLAEWLRRFEADHGGWSFARMVQHSIAAMNANPFMKAIVTHDKQLLGRFLRTNHELLKTAIAARTELFTQLQAVGAVRDDIPPQTLAYLMGSMSLGLIASYDIFPAENQVPFEEAVRALGSLLDRGLEPEKPGNHEAAREIIIAMTKKARTVL